jgi:predicted TIM-barrel fold metal-dependent hydrolase
MNEVHGPLYAVSRAEAQQPDAAAARAAALKDQFIMDVHTHFLRPDTRIMTFVAARRAVGQAGWNPDLVGKEQTIQDLMEASWFKEVFLDSDTKVALISGAPSEEPIDWFLTNDMKFDARKRVNDASGTKRVLSHAIFTPGRPGWMEEVERTLAEDTPDGWKGYTIGDNTHQDQSAHPWRLDDRKLMYPFYERVMRSGVRNIAIHKGLFPPAAAERNPRLTPFAGVEDVGRAAKDWPEINFLIYHAAYRNAPPNQAAALFEATGRMEWLSDLAEIPARYNVRNVYADVGAVFGGVVIGHPRLAAGMIGTLVQGLGLDRVLWGTDSVWYGSPQWQIEALRRLTMPEDLIRRYGLPDLGEPEGRIKNAILGLNGARIFGVEPRTAALEDGFDALKRDYAEQGGPARHRSLHAWGYVAGRPA